MAVIEVSLPRACRKSPLNRTNKGHDADDDGLRLELYGQLIQSAIFLAELKLRANYAPQMNESFSFQLTCSNLTLVQSTNKAIVSDDSRNARRDRFMNFILGFSSDHTFEFSLCSFVSIRSCALAALRAREPPQRVTSGAFRLERRAESQRAALCFVRVRIRGRRDYPRPSARARASSAAR